MVRAMSYQFPDMAFGVIQVSEAKTMKNMDFGQLFKKDPPHLLLMVLASQPGPDGTQGMGLSFQPYMGQWSADKLTRFLKMHSKDEDRVLDDVGHREARPPGRRRRLDQRAEGGRPFGWRGGRPVPLLRGN